MCIIRMRRNGPDEEAPVVVPICPIPRSQRTTHSTPVSSRTGRLQQPQQQPTRLSASSGFIVRQSGSQQQIVIAKQPSPSPRTSRPKIQHGSSYSYRSGPVPRAELLERPLGSDGERRRSHSHQAGLTTTAGRRSGSVKHHQSSPKQSSASLRSTREKIVIVDETGRRRESGFH